MDNPQRALFNQVERRHLLVRVLQYAETDVTQTKSTVLKLLSLCEEDLRAAKFLQPFSISRMFKPDMDVSDRTSLVKKTRDLIRSTKEMQNIKIDPELVSCHSLKRAIALNESKDESFVNSIVFWRLITLSWSRISMVMAIHANCESAPFGITLGEDDQMAIGDLIFHLFERLNVMESCGKILIGYLLQQDEDDVPAVDYLISEFERLPFASVRRQIVALSEELPTSKRLEVAVRRMEDSMSDFSPSTMKSKNSSDSSIM